MAKQMTRFETEYQTSTGILWVFTDAYVILIRIADGLCRRFTYEELGFREEER